MKNTGLLFLICFYSLKSCFAHQLQAQPLIMTPTEYTIIKQTPKTYQQTISSKVQSEQVELAKPLPPPSFSLGERVGNWLKNRPSLFLAFGFTSVIICCMGSQAIVRFSK